MVWKTDAAGVMTYVNRGWIEYTGLDVEDSALGGWLALVHPDDEHASAALWLRSVHGGEDFEAYFRIRHRDGLYRWHLNRAHPQRDGAGRVVGWFGTATDVEDQKRAALTFALTERERRCTEEANRLKDEFLANMNHELRTPLTAILGWARVLRTHALSEETRVRALEKIERNGAVQVRLIEDLLDASRILAGALTIDLAPVDVALVVETALAAARPGCEAKGIALRSTADPAVGVVQADAGRLQQVMDELLSNAVEFTPAGGSVDVRLDASSKPSTPAACASRCGTRGRGSAPTSCPTSSSGSGRPTAAPRARTAASCSASRSPAASSRSTEARSTSRARAKGVGRRSPSPSPALGAEVAAAPARTCDRVAPSMSSLLRASSFCAAHPRPPPPRAAGGASLAVPAGPGQQALALRVEAGGVRVHACSAAPCSPDGGPLVAPPEGPAPRLDQAKAVSLPLDGGRAVARVDVPGDAEGSAWVLLVAAPLAGKGADPVVVWSGWTGVPRGEEGEERRAVVIVEPPAHGGAGARVLVGERREDVTLCGRAALVAAQALDPATLGLARGASMQNLGAEERARAIRLTAERARGPAPSSSVRVLRATAASSAFDKRLAALTDGDPATAGSENKAGEGRGEFVTMSAPEEVGITGFDVIVRPTEDVPEGAAPKRFYLATPSSLFEVTMPEDAWKQPAGTRYTIKLPAEIRASCLAVVLDEAFPHGAKDPRVTIAEIEARTAFDGATPEALAGALAGGGDRAGGAAAILMSSGPAGVGAAIGAYDKLDEAGQRLAERAIDAAPCSVQAPFYARHLGSASAGVAAPMESDPALAHTRDRLHRCGHASAQALADLIVKGAPRAKVLAADELAALAPAEAVAPLLDAIGAVDDATRRDLRAALARAARIPRAFPALHDELAAEKLAGRSETAAIDLLRAAGPSLGQIEGAPAAFASLAARATSVRGRFLLQGAGRGARARGGRARRRLPAPLAARGRGRSRARPRRRGGRDRSSARARPRRLCSGTQTHASARPRWRPSPRPRPSRARRPCP